MSLSVALGSALSSLLVTEKQMAVTSNNIANASVVGYTRKTVDVATQTVNGQATGVTDLGILAKSNSYLVQSMVEASGDNGYASTNADYYNSVDILLGTISGSDSNGTSLASQLSDLTSALADLQATPESESLKGQFTSDLEAMATTLRETAQSVQNLRADADDAIETTVGDINGLLHEIDTLNSRVQAAQLSSQSTADLEDERMNLLQELGSLINIDYFTTDSGSVNIYTSGGQTLLGTTVHELSYDSLAAVSSDTSWSDGDFDAITLNGVDITASLKTGSLKALVDQRDTVLPDLQATLDTLASSLIDSFNSLYNQGSSNPPVNSLTGSTIVNASDSLAATGTIRIATTDADGTITALHELTLDNYATVQDLVDGLNALDGVNASIDSEGHVVVQAADSSGGIAINSLDSAVGSDETGLSAYFGLNDLLTGTSATDIALRADLAASPGLLATGALDSSSTLAVGDPAVGAGASDIITALADALTAEQSFTASGFLRQQTSSFADYAAAIISHMASAVSTANADSENATDLYTTLQDSFSSQFGVNVDEETALLTQLETSYSTAAQIISTVQAMYQSLLDAVS